MKILFDLDGTVIDSRLRLYRLFCDITSQTLLSFGDYWNLKRSMINHEMILTNYFQYTNKEYLAFEKKWLSLIETDDYLKYDKPFDFTKNVLQVLKSKNHQLYLVTARQSKENVYKQLTEFELFILFEHIFVTESKKSKLELLQEAELQLCNDDILVGDTGLDIKTAKALHLKSGAVLSGFRNKDILNKYLPDFIENDIQFLINYVEE
jgi:phosphoglycolate phosphatase